MDPVASVWWDGRELTSAPSPGARELPIDARCLAGQPVPGAWVHVCASPDLAARIPYDQPEVQQARRDALAWWFDLLGDDLVCTSTIALDAVHTAGAITAARDPRHFADDPFTRLFPGTVVRSDLLCAVAPPPGPILERYSGAPWPAGGFG